MKTIVMVLSLIYAGLVAKGLVKRDKDLFRIALVCWAGMMLVIYFVYWPKIF